MSYIRLQTLAGAHLQQGLQLLPVFVGTTCCSTHELNDVISLILSILPIHGTPLGDIASPVPISSLSGRGMETTEKNQTANIAWCS